MTLLRRGPRPSAGYAICERLDRLLSHLRGRVQSRHTHTHTHSSWSRRLWCVFELAAFISSRPSGEKPRIVIRPTVFGLLLLASWIALLFGGLAVRIVLNSGYVAGDFTHLHLLLISLSFCSVIFLYIAHLAREYCRDLTTLCQHVAHFRVEDAECHCCSVNHRTPGSDVPIICDRTILLECIKTWFGSIEAFEEHVQTSVYDVMVEQLSHQMISYWRLASASPLFFWTYLDNSAFELFALLQHGMVEYYRLHCLSFVVGLTLWLALAPLLFRVQLRLAWTLQERSACRAWDLSRTLLLLVAGCSIFISFLSFDYWLYSSIGPHLQVVSFTLVTSALAILAWRCLPVPLPRRTKKRLTELTSR